MLNFIGMMKSDQKYNSIEAKKTNKTLWYFLGVSAKKDKLVKGVYEVYHPTNP